MSVIRNQRIRLAVPAALLTVFLLILAPSMHGQKATAAKSPVAAQCATCHEDIVKQYGTTKHGKADQFGTANFESCASCHGDVAAHAESGDPGDIYNPGKDKPLNASEKCLSCHNNQHTNAFWQGSAHETSNVGCTSCHSAHHPKSPEKLLIKSNETQTCLSCIPTCARRNCSVQPIFSGMKTERS